MKKEEKIKKIRDDHNWNCPYQSVKFIGCREDGKEEYLLSQMGNGQYFQMTVSYDFSNS
jgi:hypothetical protein